MWIFDDVWMCPKKTPPRWFHGAPVLAGAATPQEPCAAELRVALRGCAAALCRKLALLEGQRSPVSSGARDSGRRVFARFFGTAFYRFVFLFWLKDTFADFATLVREPARQRGVGVWWIGWEGPGWMMGSLAVQASTSACWAGPWNSCKTWRRGNAVETT